MTVHFQYFLPALLLLWMPRSWLYWRERPPAPRRRGTLGRLVRRLKKPSVNYDRTTRVVRFWPEFFKRRNLIDLARAGVGAWAVCDFSFTLEVPDPAAMTDSGVGTIATTAMSTILLVAVAIQTFRPHGGRMVLVAPIYFVTGVSMGVLGVLPGLLAWALIWALSPLLFGPERLLLTYTLLLGLFGPLFGGYDRTIAWMPAAAALLPVLVSLFGKRPLRLSVQRKLAAAGGSEE